MGSLSCVFGQKIKEFVLPGSLREISGLEYLDDKTIVAINDSGNTAELFVLKENGELIKRVDVENATNRDWEDLASDGEYLYIADIGNNANKRQNLCIYKVRIQDVLEKFSVRAEKIEIKYAEQKEFPPNDKDFKFDAEAIAYMDGKLWLFTKTNTKPWNGNSLVYQIPTISGEHLLKSSFSLHIGDDGWWQDAITSADVFKGKLFLSTYNRIIVYSFTGEKPKAVKTMYYKSATQKESILVKNEKKILVADERQALLGGGKIYHIPLKID